MKKEYDLYGGKKIFMDDRFFKLTTDTVLLSSFVKAGKSERGLDLGAGVGCLGILVSLKNGGVTVDGIEIVPGAAALARENYGKCGVAGEIVCGDYEKLPKTRSYDFCVSNPPYFGTDDGKQNISEEMRRARHSELGGLFAAADGALGDNGRLFFCIRPQRLGAALTLLSENGFYAVRVRYASESAEREPFLAMVEAARGMGETVTDEPLILRDENGHTEEYKRIYGF